MNSIVIFFVTNLLLMSSPSLSDGESWIGVGGTNSIAHKNIVVESFTNTNLLSSLIRNSKQTNDYFIGWITLQYDDKTNIYPSILSSFTMTGLSLSNKYTFSHYYYRDYKGKNNSMGNNAKYFF